MNRRETLILSAEDAGHYYPGQYPAIEDLGAPLGIRQVAAMIGCSVWNVRHRQIPAGLPYFRTGPSGRLIFYRNQVVRWILKKERGEVS